MASPYFPPPARPPRRPLRTVDVTVTVILLVVLAPVAFIAAFYGLFTGMASDGCFDSEVCNDRVGLGTLINAGAPVVCWVGSLVVCLVLMARRRLAFWVPVVGVLAWAGLLVLGLSIATSAMP